MIVRISADGRISIPASIRRKLGIKPKSCLKVEVRGSKIVLTPVRTISDVEGIFRQCAEGKTSDWDQIRSQAENAVARVKHEISIQ